MEIQRLAQHAAARASSTENGVREKSPVRPAHRPDAESVDHASARVDIPSDALDISEQALEMARVREVIVSAPEIREERVAKIKQSIEDGTYTISPDVLARRLLGGS